MHKFNKSVHIFSLLVASATLFLIFAGGLVTSTDSGLAVPDWPLSYGRLMPPMIGGIFFEHGHRMVATLVGFLTLVLAFLLTFKQKEKWIKKAGWAAVALVIIQGILGGVTVLFRLPKPISILHACTAQAFLCLTVALAVWTSSFWKSSPTIRRERKGAIPLHQVTLAFAMTTFAQLLIGATLRHTGWGLTGHIACALVILCLASWTTIRIRREHADLKKLNLVALVVFLAVLGQIALGLTTYFILGYEFSVVPPPFYVPLMITTHVALGAFILAASVVLALVTFRTKPSNTSPQQTRFSDYFELTKPGITFTAGITALAGFVLGSTGPLNLIQLFHTGFGTLLISAGACTLNMLIEKDVDARMRRTKRRPLPSGRLKPGEALFLGTFLSVVAILYLSITVNLLTAFIAGLTLSVYLYVYTPLKKVSALCTLVGAVAGALPPVMGWAAARGALGLEALVLFGILFFWQFPHFFSLAWLYKDDYALAGLHMLPRIQDNGTTTAVSATANSLALLFISLVPTWMGLTGYVYFGFAVFLGLWLTGASFLFLRDRSILHARRLFFASLAYVPVLVILMVLNKTSL